MLLLDKSAMEIWRMLLPKKHVLFLGQWGYEEMIFYYRDYVFFVHHDGATVRMRKPEHVKRLTQEELWERLFRERDAYDYDDHGRFSIGSILLDMGFVIPIGKLTSHRLSYHIDVVNKADPDRPITSYSLRRVPFRYALYHSLLLCHFLNESNQGEAEYEVLQILHVKSRLEDRQTPY